jgi:hypothetical protein
MPPAVPQQDIVQVVKPLVRNVCPYFPPGSPPASRTGAGHDEALLPCLPEDDQSRNGLKRPMAPTEPKAHAGLTSTS